MEPQVFGAFIQARRKELGLSQAGLAEKLYVTPKAVSRWERGVGFPDIKLLEPLADALDLTLIELMQSEKMEEPLPGERAAVVVSETVTSIQQQAELSRRQKVDLISGALIIGGGACFLYCLGLFYGFEPRWVGGLLRLIALVGGVWGWRAFRSIVTEDYLRERKEGVWHTWKPWAACAVSVAGLALCTVLRDFFPKGSAGCSLTVLAGMILLLPGAYYLHRYLFEGEGE